MYIFLTTFSLHIAKQGIFPKNCQNMSEDMYFCVKNNLIFFFLKLNATIHNLIVIPDDIFWRLIEELNLMYNVCHIFTKTLNASINFFFHFQLLYFLCLFFFSSSSIHCSRMFSENRQEHQILSQEKTCSYGLYFVFFLSFFSFILRFYCF